MAFRVDITAADLMYPLNVEGLVRCGGVKNMGSTAQSNTIRAQNFMPGII